MPYSVPDIATLRAAGHAQTNWRISVAPLSMLKIWTANVNGTFAAGARSIDVDGGVMWNGAAFADVLAGQPLCVVINGKTFRVRIKTAVGVAATATITLAQNNIVWADDMPITVYRDYPLFLVPSRTLTAAHLHYKDYNIAYNVALHKYPTPVAVIGPDWAGDLSGGSVVANVYSTDSYAMTSLSAIVSWLWETEPAAGAVIDNPAAQNTFITFTVDQPYWVKLTVTDSGGRIGYTRAQYHVHGPNYPYYAVENCSYQSDRESGEAQTKFTIISGDASDDKFPDLQRMVLWSEEYLDLVAAANGGWQGTERTKWTGNIMRSTLRMEPISNLVEFEATNVLGLLNRITNYSVALYYKKNPTKWWEYNNTGITVAHMLHHLWYWHSTLFQTHPVVLPIGNVLRRLGLELEMGTLLSQAKLVAYDHGIFAQICCNDQGVIHVEQDAQLYPASFADSFDLDEGDWTDLTVEHQKYGSCYLAKLGGWKFNGGTVSTVLLSKAPGQAIGDTGESVVEFENVLLSTQALSNTLAGRIYAHENNEYPTVTLTLKPSLSQSLAFQLVPQVWHKIFILIADSINKLDWNAGKKLTLKRIETEYVVGGECTRRLIFEPYVDAIDGVTGDYPETPPADDDYPPVEPPPLPPLPPPPAEVPSAAVSFDDVNGCEWTGDKCTTWAARNTGAVNNLVFGGAVKRGWSQLQATADPEKAILLRGGNTGAAVEDEGIVEISENGGHTWLDITPPQTIADPPPAEGPWPGCSIRTYRQFDTNNAVDRIAYAFWDYKHIGVWYSMPLKTTDLRSWIQSTNADWQAALADFISGLVKNGEFSFDCDNWGVRCNIPLPPSGGATVGYLDPFQGKVLYMYWNAASGTFVTQAIAPIGALYTVTATWMPSAWFIANGGTAKLNVAWGPGAGLLHWDAGEGGMKTADWFLGPAHTPLTLSASFAPGGNPGTLYGYFDEVSIVPTPGGGGPFSECRILGMALDYENGTRLYLTIWIDGNMNVLVLDNNLNKIGGTSALYACARADMESKAIWLHPRTVWQPTITDFGDCVYVFGADANKNGYVAESTDGGNTFTDRSGLLGGGGGFLAGKRVTAMICKGDGAGGVTQFYAFGSDSNLYVADAAWTWSLVGATPFVPDPMGVSVGQDTDYTCLITNRVAGAVKVATAPAPYSVWTDKTDAHSINGNTGTISWVVP